MTTPNTYRNERVFEVIPLNSRIIEGLGEYNLKQILGPNQYGWTLNIGNNFPEILYRLPPEWPKAKILPTNDNTYTYFIPKYGATVLSGLDIRYVEPNTGYAWKLPGLVKDKGGNLQNYESIPFSTKDFKDILDRNGDLSHVNKFSTNRQVLTYLYDIIMGVAKSEADPIANGSVKYYDVNSSGATSFVNLSTELRNRLLWVFKTVQDKSFVSQTMFNSYRSSVNSSLNTITQEQITITPPVDNSNLTGRIAVYQSNLGLTSLPLSEFSITNGNLSVLSLTAPLVSTNGITSSNDLVFTAPSITAKINNKDLEFKVLNDSLDIKFNGSSILSGNSSEIGVPTLRSMSGDILLVNDRLSYIDNTKNPEDLLILSKYETLNLINGSKLNISGDNNAMVFKTNDSTLTSGNIKIDGTKLNVTSSEIGHYDLLSNRTNIDNNSFMTKSEIESYVTSGLTTHTIGLDQVTAGNSGAITIAKNNKLMSDDSVLLSDISFNSNTVINSITYNYIFNKTLSINNGTLLLNSGFNFNYPPNNYDILTFINTLSNTNGNEYLKKYVPNITEILSEITGREAEVVSLMNEADIIRPIIRAAKYTNTSSMNAPVVSSSFNPEFNPNINSGDSSNSIMIHGSLENGNPTIRYYAPIKVMGTPLVPTDITTNKRLLSYGDDSFKWYLNPEQYTNPNIDCTQTSTNTSNVVVNPVKISILNYIGNNKSTGINPETGEQFGSNIHTMISPLSYTFSDEYISKFMSNNVSLSFGRSIDEVINNSLSNHLMFTARDIIPKIAVESITKDLITISSGAYGAIKNDDYYNYFDPKTTGSIFIENVYEKINTQTIKVTATTNINISSPGGTIGEITLLLNDRVYLSAQTNSSENGLYIWNGATIAMNRSTEIGSYLLDSTGKRVNKPVPFTTPMYKGSKTYRMSRGSFALGTGIEFLNSADINETTLLRTIKKLYISIFDTKGNNNQYMLDNIVNTDYIDVELVDYGEPTKLGSYRKTLGSMRLYFGSVAINVNHTVNSKDKLTNEAFWIGQNVTPSIANNQKFMVMVTNTFGDDYYELINSNYKLESSWSKIQDLSQYRVLPTFEGFGALYNSENWIYKTLQKDLEGFTSSVELETDIHNIIYSLPVVRVELNVIDPTVSSDWVVGELLTGSPKFTYRLQTWISPKRIISTVVDSVPNLQEVTNRGASTGNDIFVKNIKIGSVTNNDLVLGYGIQSTNSTDDFIMKSPFGGLHFGNTDASFHGVKITTNSNSMFINDTYKIGDVIKPKTTFSTRVEGLDPIEPGDFVTQQWILEQITGGLIGSKINLSSVLTAGNDGKQKNIINVGKIHSDTTLNAIDGIWSVRAPRKSTFINYITSIVKVTSKPITTGAFANENITGDFGYDSAINVINWKIDSSVESFPVYKLSKTVSGNVYDWYLIRFGFYWVISNVKDNISWSNVAFSFMATKEKSPTAMYRGLNGVDVFADVNYFDSTQLDVNLPFDNGSDSFVADGSIYSNKLIKSRLGFMTNGANYFDNAIIKTPDTTNGIEFVMQYTDFGTATLNNSTVESIDLASNKAITTKEWVKDAINDVVPVWYQYNIGDSLDIGSDEIIVEGRLTTPNTSILSFMGQMIAAMVDTRILGGTNNINNGENNTLIYSNHTNIETSLLNSTFIYIELRGMGNTHYKLRLETASGDQLIVKEYSGLMTGTSFRLMLTQGTGDLKFKRGRSVR